MRWFNNLRVASKLTVSFGVILVLMVGLGVFAVLRLAQVNEQSTEIARSWLPSVEASSAMNTLISNVRVAQLHHIASVTEEGSADALRSIRERTAKVEALQAQYEPLVSSDAERALYEGFATAWQSYLEVWERVEPLSRERRVEEANALMRGEARVAYQSASEALQQLVELNSASAKAASQRGDVLYASVRWWMIVLLLASILLGLVLARTVSRTIAIPIRQMADVAEALAAGDVEQKVELDATDEVGVLARSFRELIAAQREVAEAARRLGQGDVSVRVRVRSERDTLGKAFVEMSDTFAALVDETRRLHEAAKAGVAARGDAARFEGVFHEMVDGINDMLESLAAPVNEAAEVLDRMAQRDLSARMQGNYNGEHEQIKIALNRAMNDLEEALVQVAASADQVAAASSQVGGGSQQLAQGASEQASAIEEISSSLQEMTAMTRQNAANTQKGNSVSEGARERVQNGVEDMRRLSGAITRIKASADKTAKIVKTIDEIAFQTNLLALNAAVEAARAGEAGKGFAVVAEEVRALATRSAEAAKTTTDLIEDAIGSAESGVALGEEVLQGFGEIEQRITQVREVMVDIGAAAEQQREGIDQINLAVEQMNTATQQTAANSEESASAAEELSSQAAMMRDLVGQFRLSGSGARRGVPASRPPTRVRVPALAPAPGNGNRHLPRFDPELVIPFGDEDDFSTLEEF